MVAIGEGSKGIGEQVKGIKRRCVGGEVQGSRQFCHIGNGKCWESEQKSKVLSKSNRSSIFLQGEKGCY